MSENTKTETSEYIKTISKAQYLCGLSYVWIDGYDRKFFNYFNKISTVLLLCFISSEYLSFYTLNRDNLSEKQASDQVMFTCTHTILMTYSFSFNLFTEDIKKLLIKLCVNLKSQYNDVTIETEMIKKAKKYSGAFAMSVISAYICYTIDGLIRVIKEDDTFTTVLMAWPDVKQKGFLPDVVRTVAYLLWWMFMIRATAVYCFVISLTVILTYQYKNLCCYFYNLQDIFTKGSADSDGGAKEYEDRLKFGISMHVDTMWCVEECQRICRWIFSCQSTFIFSVLCLLMLQMVQTERTLSNAVATLSACVTVLLSTGLFMCNAGDLTVEAVELPSAIFFSGWHNCYKSNSVRVRSLITLAILQSQKPVVLRSFMIFDLSYESFVTIVKASYSAFSILY